MANPQDEFDQLIDTIRGNTASSAELCNRHLTPDDVDVLAGAIKGNTSLTSLDVTDNNLADAEAFCLAEALAENTSISEIDFRHNEIGDAGLLALINVLKHKPALTKFRVNPNPVTNETIAALEAAFDQGYFKNILFAPHFDSDVLRGHCQQNEIRTKTLLMNLYAFDAESPGKPEVWWQTLEAVPAMKTFTLQHDDLKFGAFLTFIGNLPKPDTTQPLTLESFTAKQGRYAPADNPYTWQQFDKILADFNANGDYLRTGQLLELDGKTPNALLGLIIERGQVPALFCYGNWQGASKTELQTLLRALPETVQKTVTNRQQLRIALDRNTIANHMEQC